MTVPPSDNWPTGNPAGGLPQQPNPDGSNPDGSNPDGSNPYGSGPFGSGPFGSGAQPPQHGQQPDPSQYGAPQPGAQPYGSPQPGQPEQSQQLQYGAPQSQPQYGAGETQPQPQYAQQPGQPEYGQQPQPAYAQQYGDAAAQGYPSDPGFAPVPVPTKQGRRKKVIAAGTAVGVAAAGVAGYLTYQMVFGVGAQPAEALPANTMAYVSVDLDPNGAQKVAALDTLSKFTGVDEIIGGDSESDLRKEFIDGIQPMCPGLSWAGDVEPWMGDRFGAALVADGQPSDGPAGMSMGGTPVVVLQVSDEAAAEAGLAKLAGCAGSSEDFGYVVADGWAIVAESQEQATAVVAATQTESLVDDDTYSQWTDAAGDPGFANLYISPDFATVLVGESAGSGEFGGAAAVLRFSDGGMEFEFATSAPLTQENTTGADVVETLPEDTALAFGAGFDPGWFTAYTDYLSKAFGDEEIVADVISEIEDATGMSLPEDIETLFGDSAAVAIGPDLGSDGAPSIALKVQGDAAASADVMEKIKESADLPAKEADQIVILTDGDYAVAGYGEDWATKVLTGGDLGGTEAYQEVVPNSDDAQGVFFVNFNAVDLSVLDLNDEEASYLEPLKALGMSGWVDGDVAHGLLKITTD